MDSLGNILAVNTFGPNGLLHRRENRDVGVLLQTGTGTTYSLYYTFDPQGTSDMRLNGAGTILSNTTADVGYNPDTYAAGPAYGSTINTYYTAAAAGGGNLDPNSALNFDPYCAYKSQCGYQTDHKTGLILCTYRWYDPQLGRWISRDPTGYDGGINLYAYCDNNPVMRVDPSGLTDYNANFVHGEIALWQAEGLMGAAKNHGGGQTFDYKAKFIGARFFVHGMWLNSSEFGNYAAGYAGYYNGKGLGLSGVQAGGHVYEAAEDNKRADKEVNFWGDDGTIDKNLIMLGAVDAYMDLVKAGKDHRPKLGWQTRPGQTKEDSLKYIRDYNTRMFGSINATDSDTKDQGRNNWFFRYLRSRP